MLERSAMDRWLTTAIPLLAVLVGALLLSELLTSLHRPWNDMRLAPAAALLHGYELYTLPGDGPMLSYDKGPLTALVYVPAVLWPRPDVAVILGVLITVLLYFAPALALLRTEAAGQGPLVSLCFLAFCLYSFHEPTLDGPAFWIHADAPALGFGALACALIYTPRCREKLGYQLGSAACAVLAVAAKQVALPLVVGLLTYVAAADGWRALWRYGRWLVLASSMGLAGVFLLVEPKAMIFHTITMHASHPWQWGGGGQALELAFGELGYAALPPLTVLGMVILLGRASGEEKTGLRGFFRDHPWIMLVLVALISIPFGLLGRVKVGGFSNSLSYTTYYLALAALLALLQAARGAREGAGISPAYAVNALVLLVATLLALATVPLLRRFPALAADLPQNPESTAFAAARAAPGQFYFPFHPLISIMAEGRAYHTSYGLYDMDLAGRPLPPRAIDAYLPPDLRWVAIRGEDDYSLRYLTGFSRRTSLPQLPGWTVFARPE